MDGWMDGMMEGRMVRWGEGGKERVFAGKDKKRRGTHGIGTTTYHALRFPVKL